MRIFVRYLSSVIASCWAIVPAFADPLDYDEAYTHHPITHWMSHADFGWLLVDYGLFAVFLIMIG